jgi:hypothetical protein
VLVYIILPKKNLVPVHVLYQRIVHQETFVLMVFVPLRQDRPQLLVPLRLIVHQVNVLMVVAKRINVLFQQIALLEIFALQVAHALNRSVFTIETVTLTNYVKIINVSIPPELLNVIPTTIAQKDKFVVTVSVHRILNVEQLQVAVVLKAPVVDGVLIMVEWHYPVVRQDRVLTRVLVGFGILIIATKEKHVQKLLLVVESLVLNVVGVMI